MSVADHHESQPVHLDNMSVEELETQLVISTSPNSSVFQKGFLGVDGERAAIEGELQIKCANSDKWESVTIALQTVETMDEAVVDLGTVNLLLFTRAQRPSSIPATSIRIPSSIPFSIPLQSDMPQCIHTSRSSLSHLLTATLHPHDRSAQPLIQSIPIHTRRYTSHIHTIPTLPHTIRIEAPTLIEVQVPRAIYRSDENIPVYVTIPPPDRSVVLDQGLSLRNLRIDLIRDIKLSAPSNGAINLSSADFLEGTSAGAEVASSSTSKARTSWLPSARSAVVRSNDRPNVMESTLARSGAACRFHSSKTIRLRFILHPSADYQTEQPLRGTASGSSDGSVECASISQSTVMHDVSFRLQVNATFFHVKSHTERVSTLSLALTIVPPTAPAPEIDPSTDAAYRKKYDRPPMKTVRGYEDDADGELPDFAESSSSIHPSEPPPFDDAPPPFFSNGDHPSTSRPPSFLFTGHPSTSRPPPFFSHGETSTSRLPTFQESESEIFAPTEGHPAFAPAPSQQDSFEGEGVLFGFAPSEQYDGHNDEMLRPTTPPPTMEMARRDTNLTGLADLISQQPQQPMQFSDADESALLPPPPPRMDDPMDPPPSIDTDYQTHDMNDPPPSIHSQDFTDVPPSVLPARRPSVNAEIPQTTPSGGSAEPPSYLSSTGIEEQSESENVTRPPPYVELVPSSFH